MYIDNKNVKRDPKIYIKDYSGSGKDGLDHLKNLFDLSLVTRTYDSHGDPESIASGTLEGHVPMEDRVKAGNHLEFFLQTDIDHTGKTWTSIGSEDNEATTDVDESLCFKGVLHGDGHTISGLDNSLFKNLCGEVYNLGVTGSFNTAGVADLDTETGYDKKGYVENCWVKTTNTTPLSATESEKPYAVFGKPTDGAGYQLVNSYFCVDNKNLYNTTTADGVTTSGGDRGKARAMSAKAFYNGELAYDLNNFYLYKRYVDIMGSS